VGKRYVPPEDMALFIEVIPPHLHKWLDYEIEPEPFEAQTPNEERNEVDAYGRPIGAKKVPAFKPLGSSAEKGAQVVLTPKPKKVPAKVDPTPTPMDPGVDVQKALLDMALTDEDDD